MRRVHKYRRHIQLSNSSARGGIVGVLGMCRWYMLMCRGDVGAWMRHGHVGETLATHIVVEVKHGRRHRSRAIDQVGRCVHGYWSQLRGGIAGTWMHCGDIIMWVRHEDIDDVHSF